MCWDVDRLTSLDICRDTKIAQLEIYWKYFLSWLSFCMFFSIVCQDRKYNFVKTRRVLLESLNYKKLTASIKIDAQFFYFRNRKPCLIWLNFTIIIIIIIIITIIIIIVITIIIVILVFSFIQGIYNYTPEINHFSRVYIVAAVLYLQFVLHVMLQLDRTHSEKEKTNWPKVQTAILAFRQKISIIPGKQSPST